MENRERPLLIGVGNPYRSDDGVGIQVAREVKINDPDLAEVILCQNDLSLLIPLWKNRNLILIDAVHSKSIPPGSIYVINNLDDLTKDRERHCSTHGLGLIEAFQMASLLNQLPASFLLIGIVGSQWKIGSSYSEAVKERIPDLVKCIQDSWCHPGQMAKVMYGHPLHHSN